MKHVAGFLKEMLRGMPYVLLGMAVGHCGGMLIIQLAGM